MPEVPIITVYRPFADQAPDAAYLVRYLEQNVQNKPPEARTEEEDPEEKE